MLVDYTDNGERAKLLKNVKRVVVKVGSRLLMDVDGVSARQRVTELVKEIASSPAGWALHGSLRNC